MLRELLYEALRKMSDEKIDEFIEKHWGGEAITFKYDAEASTELAKLFKDIIITKDKKFMHIPITEDDEKTLKLNNIITKYKLGEI